MKKLLSIFLLISFLTLSSCEFLPEDMQKDKEQNANFTAVYDYGFHMDGKAALLLDGATVFFDYETYGIDTLIAGDVVTVKYKGGELMIQESYPATIVTKDIEIIDITVSNAGITELEATLDDDGNIKIYPTRENKICIFSNEYVIHSDMTFEELSESFIGKTLYGTYVAEGDKTKILAIYDFLPR